LRTELRGALKDDKAPDILVVDGAGAKPLADIGIKSLLYIHGHGLVRPAPCSFFPSFGDDVESPPKDTEDVLSRCGFEEIIEDTKAQRRARIGKIIVCGHQDDDRRIGEQ